MRTESGDNMCFMYIYVHKTHIIATFIERLSIAASSFTVSDEVWLPAARLAACKR